MEGMIAAFEAVQEDYEQCLLHYACFEMTVGARGAI
jgi:hypothetical protein